MPRGERFIDYHDFDCKPQSEQKSLERIINALTDLSWIEDLVVVPSYSPLDKNGVDLVAHLNFLVGGVLNFETACIQAKTSAREARHFINRAKRNTQHVKGILEMPLVVLVTSGQPPDGIVSQFIHQLSWAGSYHCDNGSHHKGKKQREILETLSANDQVMLASPPSIIQPMANFWNGNWSCNGNGKRKRTKRDNGHRNNGRGLRPKY